MAKFIEGDYKASDLKENIYRANNFDRANLLNLHTTSNNIQLNSSGRI